MKTVDYEFKYNRQEKLFSIELGGKERVVFNDFELNFRMTQLSLLNGRIHPELPLEGDVGIDFPVRLWGMGSEKTIPLSAASGRISSSLVGDSILLSYKNDIKEKLFSPEQAVRISISELPGIEKSIFFHNRSNEFQNFDCEGLWWSQSVFVDDVTTDLSHDWGMLSCWQYNDGVIAGILPVTTDCILGRMKGSANGLSIIACTGSSGEAIDSYPLVLIAFSNSVGSVIDKLFRSAKSFYPKFNLVDTEKLPEPFGKLGWCSWNAFGKDVTESDIKAVVDKFKEDKIPVRYIILDDGWSEVDEIEIEEIKLEEGLSAACLKSYEADSRKFPQGLREVIEYAKESGIEAFGVWHALNGYWYGLSSDMDIVQEQPDWFIKVKDGRIIPAPGGGFYDEWYDKLKKDGVDFLKVDNQSFHRQCMPYQDNMPEYMAGIQQDMNAAADKNDFRVIYCMATVPEIFFNCGSGHLLRVSNDFKENDAFGSRKHLVNSFYNSLWLRKVFMPDFDMFQTKDAFAETFARMLAIAGSPIYTTDRPEEIDVGLLRRMVLPTGDIPRYDALPEIMESRFFDNPYDEGNILAVTANTGDIKVLGLFNTIETGHNCSGVIGLDELGYTQDCLVYSDAGQFAPQIIKAGGRIRFSLQNMESDLITIAPVKSGFAAIGVIDFFAASAIIESVEKKDDCLRICLKDSGLFLAYCEKEPEKLKCGDDIMHRVDEAPRIGEYSYLDGVLKAHTSSEVLNILLGGNAQPVSAGRHRTSAVPALQFMM